MIRATPSGGKMKRTTVHWLIVLCALTLLSKAAGAVEVPGSAGLDMAWQKAMMASDAAAVAALYAPPALLWLPGAPEAHGDKAILAAYQGFLAQYAVSDITLGGSAYQVSGDLSAGWGHFSMKLTPKKGGDPIVMTGRFISASKKFGTRWLYVADQASADPPPPAAAPAKKP
jgi:ketosteroid isomerase-like protein